MYRSITNKNVNELVVVHGVCESVVQGEAEGACGARRGGGDEHAARVAFAAARVHQQSARVRARARALPPTSVPTVTEDRPLIT